MVAHVDGPRTKLFVTLFLILALVVVGEIAGVVLGRAVRGAIRNPAMRTFDSTVGVALQIVAVTRRRVDAHLPAAIVGSAEPGRRGARL